MASSVYVNCLFPAVVMVMISATVSGILFHSRHDRADLTVSNRVLEVGEPLTVNCTLKPSAVLNVSVTDLQISFRGRVDLGERVILNERTVQLVISSVSINNSGSYNCKVNGTWTASRYVTVGYAPNVSDVTVHCMCNNYENLTCWWQPRLFGRLKTTWTLIYKLGHYAIDSHSCPAPHNNSECHWTGRDFTKYFPYIVYLNVSNALGSDRTREFEYEPLKFVRPNHVNNLLVDTVTSRSAVVTWTLPSKMRGLAYMGFVYNVSWHSSRDDHSDSTDKQTRSKDAKVRFHLSSLKPHTEYHLNVSVKTAKFGFWSPQQSTVFTTLEDVPAESPSLSNGSFVHTSSYGHSRTIILYIKDIPESLRNGKIIKVTLQITPIITNVSINASHINDRIQLNEVPELTNESQNYIFLHELSNDVGYKITLTAYTQIGAANRSSTVIILPSKDIPPSPDRVLAEVINETHVNVSWQYDGSIHAPDGFIVHYCQGKTTQPDEVVVLCKTDYQWVSVAAHYRQLTVRLVSIREWKPYHFGVSMVMNKGLRGSRSSAIKWASCLYEPNGVPGKVQKIQTSSTSSTVQVTWGHISCVLAQSRIQQYTVSYGLAMHLMSERETCPTENKLHFHDALLEEAIVSGLVPYTAYIMCVRAETKTGVGPWSDPVFITTSQTAPSDSARSLTISNITASTFLLTWKPPLIPNGDVIKYIVHIQDITSNIYKVDEVNVIDELQQRVTGLCGHCSYRVWIQACNILACSPDSEALFVQTHLGAPSPIDFSLEVVSPSELHLYWSTPQQPNGPIDTMRLHVSLQWPPMTSELVATEQGDSQVAMKNYTFGMLENDTKLEVDCTDKEPFPVKMTVRAVNVDEVGILYLGQSSEEKTQYVCSAPADLSFGAIIGIIVAGVLAGSCVCLVIYRCYAAFCSQEPIKIIVPSEFGGSQTIMSDISAYPYLEQFDDPPDPPSNNLLISPPDDKLMTVLLPDDETVHLLLTQAEELMTETYKDLPVSVDSGRESLSLDSCHSASSGMNDDLGSSSQSSKPTRTGSDSKVAMFTDGSADSVLTQIDRSPVRSPKELINNEKQLLCISSPSDKHLKTAYHKAAKEKTVVAPCMAVSNSGGSRSSINSYSLLTLDNDTSDTDIKLEATLCAVGCTPVTNVSVYVQAPVLGSKNQKCLASINSAPLFGSAQKVSKQETDSHCSSPAHINVMNKSHPSMIQGSNNTATDITENMALASDENGYVVLPRNLTDSNRELDRDTADDDENWNLDRILDELVCISEELDVPINVKSDVSSWGNDKRFSDTEIPMNDFSVTGKGLLCHGVNGHLCGPSCVNHDKPVKDETCNNINNNNHNIESSFIKSKDQFSGSSVYLQKPTSVLPQLSDVSLKSTQSFESLDSVIEDEQSILCPVIHGLHTGSTTVTDLNGYMPAYVVAATN